jgi:hypothetical protein
MVKKGVFFVLFLIFLLGPQMANCLVSVGVKKGDWIEYDVTTTGNPPTGHDVTWARLEILEVQGTELTVNVTTEAINGTFASNLLTLNPALGQVGVWYIIPSGLDSGDSFYDANEGKNVTIQSISQRTIAGAARTVTQTAIAERIKSWDKNTGVFVETIDSPPGYTLDAIAVSTNMWSPQVFGLDPLAFYILVLSFVVLFNVLLAILVARRRRK